MNRCTLYPLIFLIFQIKYSVKADFEVNEDDVIKSHYEYNLSSWSKDITPEGGVWSIHDGRIRDFREGGTLRYVKMLDGSEYFQIYDTDEVEETQTNTDGKPIRVTLQVPITAKSLGLLKKGKAAIHLSQGVKVIISPNLITKKAYALTFQSGEDARNFTNFFDKMRTESPPAPID